VGALHYLTVIIADYFTLRNEKILSYPMVMSIFWPTFLPFPQNYYKTTAKIFLRKIGLVKACGQVKIPALGKTGREGRCF
jgi:hypothetical protein